MRININKEAVGLRIKQIRLDSGHTLEAFGKLFNTSKSNVLRWEQGLAVPNKERLASISKFSNITVNELLYGSVDEFLESNAFEFVKSSKYPFFAWSSYDITKICIEYINNHNLVSEEKITVNDIVKVQQVFYQVLEDEVKEMLSNYEKLKDLLRNKPKISKEIIEVYSSGVMFEEFENSASFSFMLDDNENAHEFVNNLIESDDIENKFEYYKSIKDIIKLIEKQAYSFYFTIGTTLYVFSLEKLKGVKISTTKYKNLHSYITPSNSDDDVTLLLKTNKYKISDFKFITGLFNENDDTLYYLAHYSRIEDVPLNTEAQYFILNHDNSYFISKITEKPDCKYLAPILGKME